MTDDVPGTARREALRVAALARLDDDPSVVAALEAAFLELRAAAGRVRGSFSRNDEPAFGFHPQDPVQE